MAVMFRVTYERKYNGGSKTIERDFHDETMALSEVNFVNNQEMTDGSIWTAKSYKKIRC